MMSFLTILFNTLVLLMLAPLFEGVIRRLTARIQSRQGPPLMQPYLDLVKLLGKENLTAGNPVFQIAPLAAFASVVAALAMLPLGFRHHYLADHIDIISLIYLLTLGGISVLLGALSSRNIFASIGASREMATMIMIEPVLAMTLILGAVKVRSMVISSAVFSLEETSYTVSVFLMLTLFLLALQAFVGRQPFDIAEAESEIVEGPFIEYSGPNYALFKMYLMAKQVFYAALFVIVFLPFSTGIYALDILIQMVEILLIFVLIASVSATNPRFRIDQAVKYYSILFVAGLCTIGMTVLGY